MAFSPSQEESNGMKMQKCVILGEAMSGSGHVSSGLGLRIRGKTQFLRALAGDTFCEVTIHSILLEAMLSGAVIQLWPGLPSGELRVTIDTEASRCCTW